MPCLEAEWPQILRNVNEMACFWHGVRISPMTPCSRGAPFSGAANMDGECSARVPVSVAGQVWSSPESSRRTISSGFVGSGKAFKRAGVQHGSQWRRRGGDLPCSSDVVPHSSLELARPQQQLEVVVARGWFAPHGLASQPGPNSDCATI